MYNLESFVGYTSQTLKLTDKVLAWSKASGYYFTQIGFCVDVLIVAIEEV